jgi:cytochrome c553
VTFIVAAMLAAATLVWYSFRKTRPDIPADQDHIAARRQPEACMTCHGRNGVAPRSANHPMGRDCEHCHYWEGEAR